VLRFAICVNNQLPTSVNKDQMMLIKLWTGKEETLEHVYTFGCLTFILQSGNHDKLSSLSKCIMINLGPADNNIKHHHHHCLMLEKSKSIVTSHDVTFQENVMVARQSTNNIDDMPKQPDIPTLPFPS